MTDLPSGWTYASLGELTSKIGSGATPKGGGESYHAAGVPLIRSMNVHFESFRRDGLVFLDDAQASALQSAAVLDGDVLLNITGASIGRVNIAPEDMHGARVNQHVAIIRVCEGVVPKYISYFLASPGMQRVIQSENYGVTRQALTKAMIEGFGIPVPPLPEQRRIVAKLDSLRARSARARDELDRIPLLIERYKQAVLAKAFTGDLTAECRNDRNAEELRRLLERHGRAIDRQFLDPKASDGSTLHPLPTGWSWMQAQDAVEPGAEIVYGIIQPGPKLDVGVPYVRGTDIQNGRILVDQLLKTSPEIAGRYARASLRGGDVLLGIIRDTKVAIVPDVLSGANITQGTARLRPVSFVLSDYVAHWLRGDFAQKWLHDHYRGIDMPGLNLRDVRRCPIPVAPPAEQREIVRIIENAFARLDKVAAEHARAAHLLHRLDQAILAKAFRGELVPQDPNDEPASVMLDRLRAERAAAPTAARRGRRPAA